MREYVPQIGMNGEKFLKRNSGECMLPPLFCISKPSRGGDGMERAYGRIFESDFGKGEPSVVPSCQTWNLCIALVFAGVGGGSDFYIDVCGMFVQWIWFLF